MIKLIKTIKRGIIKSCNYEALNSYKKFLIGEVEL